MLYFDSWTAFFHMGGYATYVWTAFGSCWTCIFVMWWHARRYHKQLLGEIQKQQSSSIPSEPMHHEARLL